MRRNRSRRRDSGNGTGYKRDLDQELGWSRAVTTGEWGIEVGLYRYGTGPERVSVHRPERPYRKLGRLSADEALRTIPALFEGAVELMRREGKDVVSYGKLTDEVKNAVGLALRNISHRPVSQAQEEEEVEDPEVEDVRHSNNNKRRGALASVGRNEGRD